MSWYGVRRLVVINSGSYAFADVSLEGAIHLVAPNNRGKSTLVNALQFLYIDDIRHMRFPKSAEETREHYFGSPASYLLFECVTATGPQSLLVVGRGKMNGSEFDRFVFAGGYAPADFSDDEGRVVPFDVLRARLAGRSLVEVRPAELWEALGTPTRRPQPQHNGHPVARLGLLPVKTKEDYRSFRETYVRLLSLSDANAAELRRLLIACNASHVSEAKLDVAAEYKEEFERADRSDNRLTFLVAARNLIEEGERVRAEIESRASLLRTAAPAAMGGAARLRTNLLAARQELEQDAGRVAKEQRSVADQRSQFDREIGGVQGELAQAAASLAQVDALHKQWSGCTPEMLQAMRDNADALLGRVASMRDNLRHAGEFNLAALKRDTEALRRESETQGRALANWEKRVSSWLLSHGLRSDELVTVFRLLNPSILHLLVGEDVSVADGPAIVERLRRIAAGMTGDGYSDPDVSIGLTGVAGPATDDLRDPEVARQGLGVLRRRLGDALESLRVAEDVGKAKDALRKEEAAYEGARARLDEHAQYRTRWDGRPEAQARFDGLKAGLERLNAELSALEARSQRLTEDAAKIRDGADKLVELARQLDGAVERARSALESADVAGTPDDAAVDVAPGPLDDLVRRAQEHTRTLEGMAVSANSSRLLRARLKSVQDRIVEVSEAHPGQRVYFSDQDAEWSALIDDLQAVAELEATTAQNWETLFTTMMAKLDGLVQGVRAIGTAAGRINAAMKRHHVSNLREVQLVIERQHDACNLLEALTQPDGLFADPEKLGLAKDDLRRWIKEGRIIRLDDLFSVHIRIQTMDGTWTGARSLDDIGSTGTRMTAKAMIFIQLVRAVVDNARFRLHFYLDETGQLDDYNLEAITSMAGERGVVPITAEPRVRIEPLAHPAVTVYALAQASDGRFGIDSKRTIRAARRAPSTAGGERVAEPA